MMNYFVIVSFVMRPLGQAAAIAAAAAVGARSRYSTDPLRGHTTREDHTVATTTLSRDDILVQLLLC